MKITVGKRKFAYAPGAQANLGAAEDAIVKSIWDDVTKTSTRYSAKLLKRLQAKVLVEANAEAERLFDVILAAMDEPRKRGLTYADMAKGMKGEGISGVRGKVDWPDLSLKYSMWKLKRPDNNPFKKFRLTNTLYGYFRRQGVSIVKSRLGGVKVTVTPGPRIEPGASINLPTFLVGRMTVSIFPKLAPALAPGLSTRSWSTVAMQGQMERNLLPSSVSVKLVNRSRPYRPLVAPTVQFFALVRIPNQIRRTLGRNLSNAGSLNVRHAGSRK